MEAVAPPLSPAEFASLMAALGPFEDRPRVAVGVSGGADSLALCLLLNAWARARGGAVVGLSVDHGLRPEAAAEARQVGAWLAARGIGHRVLPWRGPKPKAGLQARARAARYDLMTAWCGEAGVLHLALGHQRMDQAETFLMRLGRGSGPDGLAAMSALVERGGVRLLRPLLDVPPARLEAALAAWNQPWIEDPSNRDPVFTRVRTRALLPALAWAGAPPAHWAALARDFGRLRQVREEAVARLLAGAVELHPTGFARLDTALLGAVSGDTARAALARVVLCLGGGAYAPRRCKLDTALDWLREGAVGGRTLGGCRLVAAKEGVFVCAEARRQGAPVPLAAGETVWWERRFLVSRPAGDAGPAWLGRLGAEGWAELVAAWPAARELAMPHPARLVLPALHDARGLRAVPSLGFDRLAAGGAAATRAVFRPANPLTGTGFYLAPRPRMIKSSGERGRRYRALAASAAVENGRTHS